MSELVREEFEKLWVLFKDLNYIEAGWLSSHIIDNQDTILNDLIQRYDYEEALSEIDDLEDKINYLENEYCDLEKENDDLKDKVEEYESILKDIRDKLKNLDLDE